MNKRDEVESVLKSLETDCLEELSVSEDRYFNIVLAYSGKSLIARYGWDEGKKDFLPSNVVDVLLSDEKNLKHYVTYITEVNNNDLRYALEQIVKVANAYFRGEFSIIKRKNKWLHFDIPGLVYSEFAEVRVH